LRLNDGFDVNLFYERTGILLNTLEKPLQLAEQKGLIERDHLRIRPTALGRLFLNDIQELFLSDDSR
jgi:oxygen-independent coproporphyrinogen-3 oxidase